MWFLRTLAASTEDARMDSPTLQMVKLRPGTEHRETTEVVNGTGIGTHTVSSRGRFSEV